MTLDFQTFDSLTVPANSSAAAQIAAALPHSAVLKAFNTNFAATPCRRHHRRSVRYPPDRRRQHPGQGAARRCGYRRRPARHRCRRPRRARELEALGFLQITLAAQQKMPWTGGFAVAA